MGLLKIEFINSVDMNLNQKQQSHLQFVNKLRVAQACKIELFIYSFVCRANKGRDIAPLIKQLMDDACN